MAFQVYDYRTDIRNILVTPQIRARLMCIPVDETSGTRPGGRGHSHDLGHEVFLVLQGQAEFEIDGDTQVLGPGQVCIALTDQVHAVRNVGAEPVVMYLSVTPHIQPTHTGWTEEGTRERPRFNASTMYDVPTDRDSSPEELADRHLEAATALAESAEAAAGVQREQVALLKRALESGDTEAALVARDQMWAALSPMFQDVYALADMWNDLTYRTAGDER